MALCYRSGLNVTVPNWLTNHILSLRKIPLDLTGILVTHQHLSVSLNSHLNLLVSRLNSVGHVTLKWMLSNRQMSISTSQWLILFHMTARDQLWLNHKSLIFFVWCVWTDWCFYLLCWLLITCDHRCIYCKPFFGCVCIVSEYYIILLWWNLLWIVYGHMIYTICNYHMITRTGYVLQDPLLCCIYHVCLFIHSSPLVHIADGDLVIAIFIHLPLHSCTIMLIYALYKFLLCIAYITYKSVDYVTVHNNWLVVSPRAKRRENL